LISWENFVAHRIDAHPIKSLVSQIVYLSVLRLFDSLLHDVILIYVSCVRFQNEPRPRAPII
jgi:hypothetical protein